MPVMSLLYVYSCVGNQGLGKSGKVVDIERWEGESYVSFITNLSNTYYLSHRDSDQSILSHDPTILTTIFW